MVSYQEEEGEVDGAHGEQSVARDMELVGHILHPPQKHITHDATRPGLQLQESPLQRCRQLLTAEFQAPFQKLLDRYAVKYLRLHQPLEAHPAVVRRGALLELLVTSVLQLLKDIARREARHLRPRCRKLVR